jgi:hypothetical protein
LDNRIQISKQSKLECYFINIKHLYNILYNMINQN